MRLRSEIVTQLVSSGLIAVVRTERAEQVLPICEALLAGGINAIEITFTVPNAVQAIREAKQRFGAAAVLGVGTVLNGDACKSAMSAGAEFVVSPVGKLSLIEVAHAADRPIMLGAYTPTEAQ